MAVRPSPLIAVETGRGRLGQTTVLDLADARVVNGGCHLTRDEDGHRSLTLCRTAGT